MKFVITDDKTTIIIKEASHEEYHQLKLHLVRLVEGHYFKKRKRMGLWNGEIDHFHNGIMRFGLWGEIRRCCKEHGYAFDINKSDFPFDKDITQEDVDKFVQDFYKDYRIEPTESNPDGIFMPYAHQREAIYRLLKYKFGLLEVATAGGKSLIFGTFLFYVWKFINPKAKALLIVPRTGLVTQFYDDLMDYNEGYYKEQKQPFDMRIEELFSERPRKVRDGKEPNVYIGTYQTLIKYPKEFFTQFAIVATDEAHSAKAKSLDAILSKTFSYAQYRFGLSGTFPSASSAEYLTIQSLMGPKLMVVKTKELIEKDIISPLKVKAVILNYDDEHFAQSVFTIKKAGNGKKAYLLEKEYAQKSMKRMVFFRKLVDKFSSNSLILFHNISYGTDLFNYLRDNVVGKHFYYIDGKTHKEKREKIKKLMEITDSQPKVLVASFGTFSTGINIKAITNIVFADSFKSDQIIRQSIGRGLRLHKDKDHLTVFDIVDKFHTKYSNILYKQYLTRKEKTYKKQEFPVDELKIRI